MDNLFSRLVKALEKKPVFSTFITTPYITQSMDLRKLYYGIVFSCVDAIASNVSNVEYGLFTYDKNGDKKQVENNEAYNLLERPNDFMTGADLL